jgi:protein-tyrosine-phosphatase
MSRGTPVSEPEPFRILFVCTGNTCRSPLAEVLARRELEARGWRHVEVRSGGVRAAPGFPASEGSSRVAAEQGLDLSGHSSTPVDQELLEWADLVLAMSAGHLAVIQASGAGERATLLGAMAAGEEEAGAMGIEVPDPFGQDDAIYRDTYRVLEGMIVRVLDRLEPIVAP